jgi:hypothetical protein
MRYLQLFEEFNPYTGEELAKKLRMLASASDVVSKASPITQEKKDFVFMLNTKLKGDHGNLDYKVFIPFSQIEKARVVTFQNGKQTFSANIEVANENDIDIILTNFIETTQLFDDTQVGEIIENYKKLNSVEDVKKLLKTLVPGR